MKFPVLVHEEVIGLLVLLRSSVPAFPHRLVVPLDVSVDSCACGFAVVGLARFGIHTVSAEWGADRPFLKTKN